MANQTIRSPILDVKGNQKEIRFQFEGPKTDDKGNTTLEKIMLSFGSNYRKLEDLKNAPDKNTFGQMFYGDGEMAMQPDEVYFPFKKRATKKQQEIFSDIAIQDSKHLIQGVVEYDPRNIEKLVTGKNRSAVTAAFKLETEGLQGDRKEGAERFNKVVDLVRNDHQEKEKQRVIGADMYVRTILNNVDPRELEGLNYLVGGNPNDLEKLSKILLDYHTSRAVEGAIALNGGEGIDNYVRQNLIAAKVQETKYQEKEQAIKAERESKLAGLVSEARRTEIETETSQKLNDLRKECQYADTDASHLYNGFTQIVNGAAENCTRKYLIAQAAAQQQQNKP